MKCKCSFSKSLLVIGFLLPTCAFGQAVEMGHALAKANVGPTDRWPGDEVEMRHLATGNAGEVNEACVEFADRPVEEALPFVISAVHRIDDPSVQARCVFTIARIGPPQAEQLLKRMALDAEKNALVRVAAIQGLPLIEGADLHFLIDLLSDQDLTVQTASARTLAETQTPGADTAIRRMLNSKQPKSREAAIISASLWPEMFHKELVSAASTSSNSVETRIGALTAVEEITPDAKAKLDLTRLAALVTVDDTSDSVSWFRRLWNWITVRRLSRTVEGASISAVRQTPGSIALTSEPITLTESLRVEIALGLSTLIFTVAAIYISERRTRSASRFESLRSRRENERSRREGLRTNLVEFIALVRTLDPERTIRFGDDKVGERLGVQLSEKHHLELNRAFTNVAMLLTEENPAELELLSLMSEAREMLLLLTGESSATAERTGKPGAKRIESLVLRIERSGRLLMGKAGKPFSS